MNKVETYVKLNKVQEEAVFNSVAEALLFDIGIDVDHAHDIADAVVKNAQKILIIWNSQVKCTKNYANNTKKVTKKPVKKVTRASKKTVVKTKTHARK